MLLCDELSLGLAPIIIKEIYDAMPRITADGMSVVIVEQDVSVAQRVSQRGGLPSGRPRVARGRQCRPQPRADQRGVLRGLSMVVLEVILQGVMLGGLYALLALGLSLMFGVMRLTNTAHGDFIVMAAFGAIAAASLLALQPWVAALLILPLAFAAGYALQRWVLNGTLGKDPLPSLVVTFGLSIVIQNALAGALLGRPALAGLGRPFDDQPAAGGGPGGGPDAAGSSWPWRWR